MISATACRLRRIPRPPLQQRFRKIRYKIKSTCLNALTEDFTNSSSPGSNMGISRVEAPRSWTVHAGYLMTKVGKPRSRNESDEPMPIMAMRMNTPSYLNRIHGRYSEIRGTRAQQGRQLSRQVRTLINLKPHTRAVRQLDCQSPKIFLPLVSVPNNCC